MKMDILMLAVFENSGGLPKNFGKLVAPQIAFIVVIFILIRMS